ncbi:hypothetical protein N9933_02035, partial [bacterium]|nr:hypothetical protein [bacterium]
TPDEDAHVVIKVLHTGHYAQPVINESVEVASIEIQAGATLTIEENGEVLIDGEYTYTQGIVNNGGSLINQGQISLLNVEDFSSENFQITLKGKGLVTIDGISFNEMLLAID